jgi:DNA polymerase III epsilon subunit-like protein
MSGIIYYICDLETNGLVYRNNFHEITELSILRADERVQLSRKIKINHPENSSIDALRITGKTIEDLKTGISTPQLINDVEIFLHEDDATPEHRCIVGHNIINFDRNFLFSTWEKYGKLFPANLWLDTMFMVKSINKKNGDKKAKSNLKDSLTKFGIYNNFKLHSAKGDSQATYFLWQKLMQETDHLEHLKRIPHEEK